MVDKTGKEAAVSEYALRGAGDAGRWLDVVHMQMMVE